MKSEKQRIHLEKLAKNRKGRKGRKHSQETKLKMSLVRKGMKLPEKWKKNISNGLKGKKTWLTGGEFKKGHIMSEEIRKKISDGHKGRKHTIEERIKMSKAQIPTKHWNWKGGITSKNKLVRKSVKFKIWREKVFARDKWTCRSCRKKGGELHAHHIKPFATFPKLRFIIKNGLTLCKQCHQKTESYKKRTSI